MSKKKKKEVKEENLFISTQKEAQTPQLLNINSDKIEFKVEDQFKCPIYISHKPEWVEPLNKASDPIIKKLPEVLKVLMLEQILLQCISYHKEK